MYCGLPHGDFSNVFLPIFICSLSIKAPSNISHIYNGAKGGMFFCLQHSHPITIINPLVWAEAVILMGFHAGGCAVFRVTRCFGKAKHAVTLTLLGLPLSHVMLNPTAWCCSAKTNEVHLMNANERWTLNIGLKTEFRNKDPALRLPCINVLQTFLSCECLHMSNLLL